jgi:formylglycine-generating enzyme
MKDERHIGTSIVGTFVIAAVVVGCGGKVKETVGGSDGVGGAIGVGGETTNTGGSSLGSGAIDVVRDASVGGGSADSGRDVTVGGGGLDSGKDVGAGSNGKDAGGDGTTDAESGAAKDGGPFNPGAPSCVQPDGSILLCNGESCCVSINVPGGTFPQGRRTENCGPSGCQTTTGNEGCPNGMTCDPSEQPEHSMTVSSFALDKYAVTVGRFRKFVAAYDGGWRPAVGSGKNPNVSVGDTSWQTGWDDSASAGTNLPKPGGFQTNSHLRCSAVSQTWTDSTGGNENVAINCANWYEAFAFCIWDGGRLATESEWEYAAAGGSENRLYPWGSAEPDCTYANFATVAGTTYCATGLYGSVVAVGSTSKGNGKWGHADLAGNVFGFVLDWGGSYNTSQSKDYANLSQSSLGFVRVSRGGGCSGSAGSLRATNRGLEVPSEHFGDQGVRCARAVQ